MNHPNTSRTPTDTGHTDTANERRQNQDCKSVLVAQDVFDWLRQVQSRTNPRLELRHLVEAAVDLVRSQPALIEQLERHARDRLKRHLASLD